MSETVIKVESISKLYDLGLVGTGTLSKDLNRTLAKLRGRPDPYATLAELNDRTIKSQTKSGTVWALKDICFDVKKGEVLGVIGRNGAGKSTLLKILSQITTPTTGEIKIKGRVASLLEVGTGMHPEMTARQNIYLNGSMMGMTRKEVTAKLDEIVDFAGVGKYIDTPIKRFSSGMTVRLGFAVAAFLEPEILIVDEVLAVGDAEFQKKAVGKMQDVSKGEGRTVLFVSHNMSSIKSLCSRALVLDNGHTAFMGDVNEAVHFYFSSGNNNSNQIDFSKLIKSDFFVLNKIVIKAKDNNSSSTVDEYDEIELVTDINLKKEIENLKITYLLTNEDGITLFTFSHGNSFYLQKGKNKITCCFPKGFLNVGQYFLSFYLILNSKEPVFIEKDIMSFEVTPGQRELGKWMGKEPGFIKPDFKWTKS